MAGLTARPLAPRQTPAPDDERRRDPRSRRLAAVALGIALTLVAAGAVVVLSQSGERLAGTNAARLLTYPVHLKPGQEMCQTGEDVPPDAATLRLVEGTNRRPGPPLAVRLGGVERRVAGGYRDGALSIPIAKARRGPATLCVRNAGADRDVYFGGQDPRVELPAGYGLTVDGKPVAAVVRVDYLRAGRESWWSVAGAVIRRWGYFTALGAATPWIAIALFLAAFSAAAVLVVRGRAGPVAIGAVAATAAAGWAFTTPVFQVPDEPQHVQYAQYLAETGKLPRPGTGAVFSPEEGAAFVATRVNLIVGSPSGKPSFAPAADRGVDRALDADPGRRSDGTPTNTTNNPPLYYLLEVGPYHAASGGNFLDRVLAMRLFSALLTGLAAAFGALFVRELLPRRPWAWTAGGLFFGLQPLLGFIGGGVNNDVALDAAAAALLWLIARAFRRGLDVRTSLGIGAALGLGLVSKATLIGFIPGLLVAAALLVLRAPGRRRVLLARIGVAAAVAAVPVVAYLLLNATIWDRSLWSGGGTVAATGTGHPTSIREFVSYLWQFYLPRLPFMTDQQAGLPVYNVWFKGLIGNYGWLDTTFAPFAYTIALVAYGGVLALGVAALWRWRDMVRRRWPELLALAAVVIGFLVVVGWAGYRGRLDNGYIFEQTRYLLPLGALLGGLGALGARGGGRRFGPAIGAVLVALVIGHELMSVLLVVGRYYA